MSKLTMVEALNLAMTQEMERDENVCLMGEDIGVNGGVFRTTKDLQKIHGETRVMDTPLAECGIVGTAVGMAIYGVRPVVEIQFSGFTDRKSTRLNSSHVVISYAVFCLKKKPPSPPSPLPLFIH